MSQQALAESQPMFIPTDVTIVRQKDGNAGGGRYNVTYSSPEQAVTSRDAVLCYRLVGLTPPEIVFTGIRTDEKRGTGQLSPATISLDGRMLTVIDSDWKGGFVNITLDWLDAIRFAHDPQVGNVPQPT